MEGVLWFDHLNEIVSFSTWAIGITKKCRYGKKTKRFLQHAREFPSYKQQVQNIHLPNCGWTSTLKAKRFFTRMTLKRLWCAYNVCRLQWRFDFAHAILNRICQCIIFTDSVFNLPHFERLVGFDRHRMCAVFITYDNLTRSKSVNCILCFTMPNITSSSDLMYKTNNSY